MQGRADYMQRFAQQDAIAKSPQNQPRITQNRSRKAPDSLPNRSRTALGRLLESLWEQCSLELDILEILKGLREAFGSSRDVFRRHLGRP